MNKHAYDVIIVGGNIVGAVTAIILSKSGLSVALLEKNMYVPQIQGQFQQKASRLLALSKNTCNILETFNIFDLISQYAQPIKQIRVTESDSKVKLDFFPKDIGLSNFGYMVNELDLLSILHKILHDLSEDPKLKLKIFENTSICAIDNAEPSQDAYGQVTITCSIGNENPNKSLAQYKLSSNLLIGADGKNSAVRKMSGIQTEERDYKQSGIVCDISHSKPHHGVAVEKFIHTGPFAILPKIGGHSSSLVWTEETKTAENIAVLEKARIESLIKERMDGYLGDIELISNIEIFPLRMVNSDKYFCDQNRVALIGDAAHSIHPVAGQGVNLGFRDIEVLTGSIIDAYNLGLDCGNFKLLSSYNKMRKSDARLMIEATSLINGLFSNNIKILKYIRNASIAIVDQSPTLQKFFTLYATGLEY